MIRQQNPGKPNPNITIQGSKLLISTFKVGDKTVKSKTLDLTPYQGGPFRLYLDADGSLSTELDRDHFWLLAEAVIPEQTFENDPTGQVDENGQAISRMVARPLDLANVEITVFELPEGGTV
jgi:hypothetical protein